MVYSQISLYDAYGFYIGQDNKDKITLDSLSTDKLRWEYNNATAKFDIYAENDVLFGISYLGQESGEISDECIDAIIGSLVIVK